METKSTLDKLTKELHDDPAVRNQIPFSAVEAYEQVTSRYETLQKRQQEMVRAAITMGDRIKELQQSHQLYRRRTMNSNSDLKIVTDRSEGQTKQIQALISRAEHDRTSHKRELDDVRTALGNI
eukprot:5394660-Amphidinium_carterae.1